MNQQIDTYFLTREITAGSALSFTERIVISFPIRRMTVEFKGASDHAALRENDDLFVQRLRCRELMNGQTLAVCIFGPNISSSHPTEYKFQNPIEVRGSYNWEIVGSTGEVETMTKDIAFFVKVTFYSD